MYRKILLITITVFEISQIHIIQALNFILLLLISIYLQNNNRPYNSAELNNMEMQALNIAAITIYFGLYYISKSIRTSVQILLFIFIVLGNGYFLLYWLYFMFRAITDILIKFFPRLRLILKRGDVFEEEFNEEKIVQEGVFFNHFEREKAYTFMNHKKEIENEQLKYNSIEDAYKDVARRDLEKLDIKEKEEENEV